MGNNWKYFERSYTTMTGIQLKEFVDVWFNNEDGIERVDFATRLDDDTVYTNTLNDVQVMQKYRADHKDPFFTLLFALGFKEV